MRTEERMILAKVKMNLWRKARDPGEEEKKEEEEEAWRTMEDGFKEFTQTPSMRLDLVGKLAETKFGSNKQEEDQNDRMKIRGRREGVGNYLAPAKEFYGMSNTKDIRIKRMLE
jgi:hypothetical protein